MRIKKFLRLGFLSDKQAHALYGMLFFLSCLMFFDPPKSLALTITLAFGVEVYDKLSGKGNLEFLDFVYTVTAPLIVYILYCIF